MECTSRSAVERVMLVESCLSFLGAEVCVRPNYGWGWRRDGVSLGPADYETIYDADFDVRIDRFFHFKGELRGIVGIVTTSTHAFSGLHVIAAEMLTGEHDFTDRLCRRYDLTLGPRTPTSEEWPHIEGPGILEGYGAVAASRELIRALWTIPPER